MTTDKKIVDTKRYKETQIPQENIYNLISSSPKTQKRSPRYQSKYSISTKQFYASNKKPHETMGFMKTDVNPEDYLRKRSRDQSFILEKDNAPHLPKEHKLPPVPKCDDAPPISQENDVNDFIQLNKVNVLRKPALRPARKMIDDRKGDSFFLEFSGLVPKFCMKKEFGKKPKYLVQRRNDLEYADKVYRDACAEKESIKLTDEEKCDLLEGLRGNWEELNKRYLRLPLMIDTNVLKTRKLDLEKKLDVLENDIYFLEKSKNSDIYILPD